MNESKKRVWTVFLIMFASIGTMLTASVFLVFGWVGYIMMTEDKPELDNIEELFTQDPYFFLASLICTQISLLILVLIAGSLSPEPLQQRMNIDSIDLKPQQWFVLLLSTLGCGGLVTIFFEPPEYMMSIIEVMKTQSLLFGIMMIIMGSVLPGIVEELLCRGYIQSRLLQRFHPVIVIVISALFFAFLHMDIFYVPFILPLGLWLSFLQYRFRSIIPCIVCHMFNNFYSFTMIVIYSQIDLEQYDDYFYVLSIGFVICLILSPFILFRKLPSAEQYALQKSQ